ncbi:hypothetical protein SCB71_07245 [Herbiconiux sp. KACC 21604]|uniref:hypothetical protein n=1 Tax=unclassified Herbiconiux TaxID=2618217 RepID=UPI001490C383|nr:hypothetical protein [Herbiconiux sp. SALV-R1]QJU53086.1 hypothetical protein HL652_05220 [Herbiconiux sp. SALV-R1]WPO88020.1 hypothetical protein SCB71_07245 [Herbiconiux sp. KACC 21604]
MVQLHAHLAELPLSRATVDVDSTLHLETHAVTFADAAARLQCCGFVLDTDTRFAYRFDRGLERVDLMCSDRHAAWKMPRHGGRPLFGIPGGTRALQQTIDLDMLTDDGERCLVIPTLRGALVLKSAALVEDSRSASRHADDLVLLLACAIDTADVVHGLSRRSRRRLRNMVRRLRGDNSPWASHGSLVQSLARESLEELALTLGL